MLGLGTGAAGYSGILSGQDMMAETSMDFKLIGTVAGGIVSLFGAWPLRQIYVIGMRVAYLKAVAQKWNRLDTNGQSNKLAKDRIDEMVLKLYEERIRR